jgi:hypothetical protein
LKNAIPIWEFLCHILDCKLKLKLWNSRVSFEPLIFQQNFLYKTFVFYQFPLISAKINFIENCNPYLGIFMPYFGLQRKTQIMEFRGIF